jgi:adenylate kinase
MNKSIPVIIFLGPPGAGKGTQASYLSREKLIPKISTGDMLRHAVQDDSELGRKVKGIMSDGGLVDDATMLSLVEDRIYRQDCENGFILDGYPRNVHQAAQLELVLKPHMQIRAIEIKVSEDEVIKRVAGRRTCPTCQRIYNIHFHAPKSNEKCDVDGSTLFWRNDDSEEVVLKRISTYRKETVPLIDHYRNKSVLQIINGIQPEKQVADLIAELVW